MCDKIACRIKKSRLNNLNQIQRTDNHHSPIKEDKSVKINNSHFYNNIIDNNKNARVKDQEI